MQQHKLKIEVWSYTAPEQYLILYATTEQPANMSDDEFAQIIFAMEYKMNQLTSAGVRALRVHITNE